MEERDEEAGKRGRDEEAGRRGGDEEEEREGKRSASGHASRVL